MAATFEGFSTEAMAFYEGLEDDNSKAYWTAHKAVYDLHIKGAMESFLASLPANYQPFHVFRPNRDVRFAKDKSPYKTMHGATSETEGSSIRYTHLAATGVLVAAGQYMMQNDQIARQRAAIDDDVRGAQLLKIIAALRKKGYEIGPGGNPPLKTAPKGYPADHPRIELLRWKGLIASLGISDVVVVTSPKLRTVAMKFWKDTEALTDWLDTNVGSTTLTYSR
jgi:uncharacterized protein (TIGR02453 family)